MREATSALMQHILRSSRCLDGQRARGMRWREDYKSHNTLMAEQHVLAALSWVWDTQERAVPPHCRVIAELWTAKRTAEGVMV